MGLSKLHIQSNYLMLDGDCIGKLAVDLQRNGDLAALGQASRAAGFRRAAHADLGASGTDANKPRGRKPRDYRDARARTCLSYQFITGNAEEGVCLTAANSNGRLIGRAKG